ncbi:hypothetical protein AB0J27_12840 [Micromonospora chokoriensis]
MPTTTTVPADLTVGGHHGWRIMAALAVTSTVGYGTLYYAYPVLLTPMAASLGASTTAVTGALTAAALLHTSDDYAPLLVGVASCCALAAIGVTTRTKIPAPKPSTRYF